MKAHDWFGIIVRSVGFGFLVYGGYSALGMLWPDPEFSRMDYVPGCSAVISVGLVLFFGAETIVRVAYRHEFTNRTPPAP